MIRLTNRSSGRVRDKVPSPNVGVRAAQLNRYAYHGYVHMKKIITQALLIALPYTFLVSVLFYTLTVNFFAVSPGEPSEIVYYGFDAVSVKETSLQTNESLTRQGHHLIVPASVRL